MRVKYWVALGCSIALGLVFISSGLGKLFGQSAFLLSVLSLTFLPDALANIVANVLPWVELVLGLLLLSGAVIQLAAFCSAILGGVFIFHNAWMITHGHAFEPCSCLGIFEKLFQGKLSSTTALYVDVGLLVLALVIYFSSSGKFLDWRPWFKRFPKAPETPTSPPESVSTPSGSV